MAGILEGKGIDKAFGGLQALNQVDVSIAQGKITGLIGPNGAGKTTLFNVLSGFLKPDRGQVTFKNTDITDKAPQAIVNQGIARSWQGLRLFGNLTVLENIMMSIPRGEKESSISTLLTPWSRNKEKTERALQISRLVNIGDRVHYAVRELSYAEQKLVAVARLLATGAEVLLLDEPTSGLDEKTVNQVIAPLLRELISQSGKTICLVEHSIKLVFHMCDYVFCLNEGRIVACGNPLELRQDEKLQRAFFYGA